jgi:hypothetical protein
MHVLPSVAEGAILDLKATLTRSLPSDTQSGTRSANMATHYYRKNRDWYEAQLSARGVALAGQLRFLPHPLTSEPYELTCFVYFSAYLGTDPFTDKEKNDLVDYLVTMPPSKAFRHFASNVSRFRSARLTLRKGIC